MCRSDARCLCQPGEGTLISALRLIALISVTHDARALNALLEDVGLIAVQKKYEALIKREMADEAIERATRDRQAFDAQWRATR